MSSLQRSWVWILGVGLAGCLLGCGRTGAPTSSGSPESLAPMGPPAGFDVESGPHAAGKKVFVANNCFRCHSVAGIGGPPPGGPPGPGAAGAPPERGGPPGKGRKRGPDLGRVGADPAHTVDWLMEYIRKPQSKKEDARMPAFDKITDTDLRALAEYLASLK